MPYKPPRGHLPREWCESLANLPLAPHSHMLIASLQFEGRQPTPIPLSTCDKMEIWWFFQATCTYLKILYMVFLNVHDRSVYTAFREFVIKTAFVSAKLCLLCHCPCVFYIVQNMQTVLFTPAIPYQTRWLSCLRFWCNGGCDQEVLCKLTNAK